MCKIKAFSCPTQPSKPGLPWLCQPRFMLLFLYPLPLFCSSHTELLSLRHALLFDLSVALCLLFPLPGKFFTILFNLPFKLLPILQNTGDKSPLPAVFPKFSDSRSSVGTPMDEHRFASCCYFSFCLSISTSVHQYLSFHWKETISHSSFSFQIQVYAWHVIDSQ